MASLGTAGWYRIRSVVDGRVVGRNFFEDRSTRPKRIVVHAALDERLEHVTRWLWTPASDSSDGDADLQGTLDNVGWKAGPHEGKIKAHYHEDWIEGGHGAQLKLLPSSYPPAPGRDGESAAAGADALASKSYLIATVDKSTYWAIAEQEGDVLAHLVAVSTEDKATPFTLEKLSDPEQRT